MPVGRVASVENTMESILTDLEYYHLSHGGVTFSGGECMLQPDFLLALLKSCRGYGIHTAIDTAGHVPWSCFEAVLADTDLFLYDIKAMDPDVHEQITGTGNARIRDNLLRLIDQKAKIRIRVPLIPGVNQNEMPGIGAFLKDRPIKQIDLLPYHRLGAGKMKALGMQELHAFNVPTQEEINAAAEALSKSGIRVVF